MTFLQENWYLIYLITVYVFKKNEELENIEFNVLSSCSPNIYINNYLFIYYSGVIMVRELIIIFLSSIVSNSAIAQSKLVYSFPADNIQLKNEIFNSAKEKNISLIASLEKENRDEFKEVYSDRFKMICSLMTSQRIVTESVAYNYLQTIFAKIVAVNPELKNMAVRLFFTRDWWPNASSLGEGTIVINAGLFIRLKNEAELAYVLCHELAHLYLDHSNQSIKKNVSNINSEEFKKEIRRLKRKEYGVNAEIENLLKRLAFNSRQHSREHETEADLQAMKFLRSTQFSMSGSITCLQMLDTVDDSAFYGKLDISRLLNFKSYPFNEKWIKNESSIFGQMKEDASGLSQKERDSLRTHPDCNKRIAAILPLISGKKDNQFFLVDSSLFIHLQSRLSIEIIEQLYREENFTLFMYFALGLLKTNQERPYAIYSLTRALNSMYTAQLNHRIGLVTDKESRSQSQDYNLICRMVDRLRLKELAEMNYYLCQNFESEMKDFTDFQKEFQQAKKYFQLSSQ